MRTINRLLLNLQLMRDSYPAVLIQRSARETYMRALEAAHFGAYQGLITLVGQAVDAGLSLWLDACERAPDDYKLPAREVAAATGMDSAYLGWLLRNQRVEGKRLGEDGTRRKPPYTATGLKSRAAQIPWTATKAGKKRVMQAHACGVDCDDATLIAESVTPLPIFCDQVMLTTGPGTANKGR